MVRVGEGSSDIAEQWCRAGEGGVQVICRALLRLPWAYYDENDMIVPHDEAIRPGRGTLPPDWCLQDHRRGRRRG